MKSLLFVPTPKVQSKLQQASADLSNLCGQDSPTIESLRAQLSKDNANLESYRPYITALSNALQSPTIQNKTLRSQYSNPFNKSQASAAVSIVTELMNFVWNFACDSMTILKTLDCTTFDSLKAMNPIVSDIVNCADTLELLSNYSQENSSTSVPHSYLTPNVIAAFKIYAHYIADYWQLCCIANKNEDFLPRCALRCLEDLKALDSAILELDSHITAFFTPIIQGAKRYLELITKMYLGKTSVAQKHPGQAIAFYRAALEYNKSPLDAELHAEKKKKKKKDNLIGQFVGEVLDACDANAKLIEDWHKTAVSDNAKLYGEVIPELPDMPQPVPPANIVIKEPLIVFNMQTPPEQPASDTPPQSPVQQAPPQQPQQIPQQQIQQMSPQQFQQMPQYPYQQMPPQQFQQMPQYPYQQMPPQMTQQQFQQIQPQSPPQQQPQTPPQSPQQQPQVPPQSPQESQTPPSPPQQQTPPQSPQQQTPQSTQVDQIHAESDPLEQGLSETAQVPSTESTQQSTLNQSIDLPNNIPDEHIESNIQDQELDLEIPNDSITLTQSPDLQIPQDDPVIPTNNPASQLTIPPPSIQDEPVIPTTNPATQPTIPPANTQNIPIQPPNNTQEDLVLLSWSSICALRQTVKNQFYVQFMNLQNQLAAAQANPNSPEYAKLPHLQKCFQYAIILQQSFAAADRNDAMIQTLIDQYKLKRNLPSESLSVLTTRAYQFYDSVQKHLPAMA